MIQKVEDFYLNPATGYGSKAEIYRKMRLLGYRVTEDTIEEILKKIKGYQTSQKRFVHYPTKRYTYNDDYEPFNECEADLIDLKPWCKSGGFILVVICILTKNIILVRMKNKTAEESAKAFNKVKKVISQNGYFCNTMSTDAGLEFTNNQVKNIFNFKVEQNGHAVIVERVIRTIKLRMRRFIKQNPDTEFDQKMLNILAENYNNSMHRTINMTPNQALHNYTDLIENLNEYADEVDYEMAKFMPGDIVRISAKYSPHKKEQNGFWSSEKFEVTEAYSSKPAYYKLKDLNDTPIEGIFYTPELKKV